MLSWLTRLGIWGLVGLFFGAAAQFAGQFGPTLRTPALLVGLAAVGCLVGAMYSWGKGNAVLTWRFLYAVPALLIGFGAYCNTGYRWIEDKAMAAAEPAERLKALPETPPPGPSPQWVAKVERDVKIAAAVDEYETTMARLNGGRITPFPGSWTPFLYFIAVVFSAIALLPTHRIAEVLRLLQGAHASTY